MADLFIVVKECASGNESIGTEWLETCSFSPATTLADVWAWSRRAHDGHGRLMVTLENRRNDADPF